MIQSTDADADLAGAFDICVVGGGILGLAVARELLMRRPGARLCIVEKESTVARHQTGHNSGVVHAGLYYKPGSLKAVLCRRGVGMLREYCAEKALEFDDCGKLVVASDAAEASKLQGMLDRATALGVPGLHLIGADGIREIEPHVVGLSALVSPTTAIVDYTAIAVALADDVRAAGGVIGLGMTVVGLEERVDDVSVKLSDSVVRAREVIVCAGLHADRVARWAGGERSPQILPFRGEYFELRPDRRHLVRTLVYPVPDPRYPFLGVHFTKRVSGSVDVGPNAVLALAREGYRWRDVAWKDLREMASYRGSWSLAKQNSRAGFDELLGSLSKRVYTKRARRYVPELQVTDLVPAGSGVRAQAVARDGSLIDDFVIQQSGRITAVRNAPSPAATASLAIASHVVDELAAR